MNHKIHPVILSGGSGSRLWPLSRSRRPKQFVGILGDESLFCQTLKRLKPVTGFQNPIIVANHHHRFIVQEELATAGRQADSIILEPFGRNTAPAIAIAALKIAQNGSPDDLMLILPSDHIISDTQSFELAIETAASAAAQNYLCTFGITPEKAETGYGYIAAADSIDGISGAHLVNAFKEKPDLETAKQYLAAGGYFWNSGMFMFKVSAILKEMETHQSELLNACRQTLENATDDLDFICLNDKDFKRVPSDSIDYAIMEKTERAAVVPCQIGWSDLGSYTSLHSVADKDENANAVIGDAVLVDSTNNYVRSNKKLVATVGISDTIVIATDDAILVASKDRDQDVKKIVDELKADAREEADHHATVYRPWGTYRSIAAGPRYQVKEISVYPGKRLSLQLHHHRAEHWVIVEGEGIVTRDDETLHLNENQSVYLPVGAKHRLENPGDKPLTLIEVQTGSYLGEDDIVRFDDDFGRGQTIE